jgi:hypothetical protein
MKTNSRNEIFIDVIPGLSPSASPGGMQDGNGHIGSNRGGNEYNITVSSRPSHHGGGANGGNDGGGGRGGISKNSYGRERSVSASEKSSTHRNNSGGGATSPSPSSSRSRSRGIIIVDQNENTSSSTDSASSSTMTSNCKDSNCDSLNQCDYSILSQFNSYVFFN